MENFLLENIEFDRPSDIENIRIIEDGEALEIKLLSEKITLRSYHEQDCCEHVYCDFSFFPNKRFYEISSIEIKGVNGMGILLCFINNEDVQYKFFIPCYNSQNGYYSDNLSLHITRNGGEKIIDITKFKQDFTE